MSHRAGRPSSARTIAGTVVTSSSSMTRGFVSRKYAFSVERVRATGGAGITGTSAGPDAGFAVGARSSGSAATRRR